MRPITATSSAKPPCGGRDRLAEKGAADKKRASRILRKMSDIAVDELSVVKMQTQSIMKKIKSIEIAVGKTLELPTSWYENRDAPDPDADVDTSGDKK